MVLVPSPPVYHQRVLGNLMFVLCRFPLDVVLGEGDEREVVQPDIFFISKEREKIIAEEEIRGAPDLVIEITSPATEDRDRHYKKTLYARHGVKEYWIVDPKEKTVEVYALDTKGFELVKGYEANENLESALLPELKVDLGEVF